jgi:dTDP-glucose 4,6-dehydratase
MPCPSLPAEDLDHVLAHTRDLWEALRGGRLFLTGGTGFFGAWLVESFLWANDRLDLRAGLRVLSRDPQWFLARMPHLADRPGLSFSTGDVCDFAFPTGSFSHVIHAATESGTRLGREKPLAMLDTIVHGTQRTLDFAVKCGAQRVFLTSSGAVYGQQPPEMAHVPEDYRGAPDVTDLHSSYGEGKRLAEHLGVQYAAEHGFDFLIARCFAFVGPHLPLEAHFAVGNFLRDALAGGPIVVAGNGTPYRSYLYAADLAIWLWTILFRATSCRPYNVGSDVAVRIAEVAAAASRLLVPAGEVRILQSASDGQRPSRYVPCVERVRTELGLHVYIGFDEALRRTFSWHRLDRNGAVARCMPSTNGVVAPSSAGTPDGIPSHVIERKEPCPS